MKTLNLQVLFAALLAPGWAAAQQPTETPAQPVQSAPTSPSAPQSAPTAQPVQSAPTASSAPPQAAPDAADDDPSEHRKGFDGRLMLDGSFRSLSATNVFAGGVHARVGGQIRHFAVHGLLGYEHGRTSFGLATNRVVFGPSFEAVLNRVRFGGAVQAIYSSFRRETRSDTVATLAIGIGAFVLFDLVRFEGGAIVGGVRADVDLLLGVQVGGGANVGVRF